MFCIRWVGFLSLANLLLLTSCDFGDDPDVGGLIGSQFVVSLARSGPLRRGPAAGRAAVGEFIGLRLDEANLADGMLSAQSATHADTFLSSLRQTLGRDPNSLDLVRVAITAGATGVSGVSSWRDAFSGDMSVSLVVEGSPPISAGSLSLPASGLDPIEGRVLVRRQTLDLFPDLRAGRFSVRLSAPSNRSPTEGFNLPVRVELEFLVF